MLSPKNAKIVKDIIRHPYAWPGGYELVAITDDGGCLCHKCLAKNYRTIIDSSRGDGWHVVAHDMTCNWGNPMQCDNCNGWILPSGMDEDDFQLWLETES